MGSLSGGIDNGTPKKHCGAAAQHPQHASEVGNWYCDGVPVLGPFVEMTVRVPLVGSLDMSDVDNHAEVLQDMLDEGLGTYIWDELDNPEARIVLRLRVKGEDKQYPLMWEDYALVVKREARDE